MPFILVAPHEVCTNWDAPEPVQQTESEPLQELDVCGLTYRFPNTGRAAIADASFTLRRGELTVITGRVGAGKTTRLRALLGLVPADGERRWNSWLIETPGHHFRPPVSAYMHRCRAGSVTRYARTSRWV